MKVIISSYRQLIPYLLFFIILGCGSSQQDNIATIIIKDKPLKVELAITKEQKQQGLMFRKRLPKDSGMLFIYKEEKYLCFWMKNTSIPLSIAYINKNGIIVDIYPLVPFSEKKIRSTLPVKYALEVNRGWFEKNGIKVGDVVISPKRLSGGFISKRI